MHLMCADHQLQAIAFQKVAQGLKRVEVGAIPHVVVHKVLRGTFLVKALDRVRPHYVAYGPNQWRLAESIQLQDASDNVLGGRREEEWRCEVAHIANVVDRLQFGRYASVYAKIPLVHDRDEGQRAERLEESFVHALRVFALALHLEHDAAGVAARFMMATEEEERIWIPDFESPEVE